jgi:hypothetical protein
MCQYGIIADFASFCKGSAQVFEKKFSGFAIFFSAEMLVYALFMPKETQMPPENEIQHT